MKKLAYIALVLAAVIAIDIAMVAFHHHENGVIVDDCPLCRFQDSGFTAKVQGAACVLSTPVFVHVHVFIVYEFVSFHNHALLASRPNAPPFMA